MEIARTWFRSTFCAMLTEEEMALCNLMVTTAFKFGIKVLRCTLDTV
jgi:hypothetical protein